jgi:hypothetical protein
MVAPGAKVNADFFGMRPRSLSGTFNGKSDFTSFRAIQVVR